MRNSGSAPLKLDNSSRPYKLGLHANIHPELHLIVQKKKNNSIVKRWLKTFGQNSPILVLMIFLPRQAQFSHQLFTLILSSLELLQCKTNQLLK